MSTGIFAQLYQPFRPWLFVKRDPQDIQPIPFHPAFENTIHPILRVKEPAVLDSPGSGPIHVNIFNGSKGTSVHFKMNSTDTIGKLKQKFLESEKTDFGGNLNLVYNGKPVDAHQTMAELQVKNGATFITYQKCHGG